MSLLSDRISINLSGKQESKILFRPRRRLRHLRGVEAVGVQVEEGQSVYYTLRQRNSDTESNQPLLKSEEVTATHHIEWDDIDFETLNLPSTVLHGSQSGVFEIAIYSTSEDRREPFPILQLSVDLNEVVQVQKSDGRINLDFSGLSLCGVDLAGVYFRMGKGLYYMPVEEVILESALSEFDASVRSVPEIPRSSASDVGGYVADTRSEDSGSSHQACESTASTDGRDTWTDGPQGYKMYNIMERRVDIRRLSSTRKNLEDLTDRRKRLHLYLSELLQQKRARVEKIKNLKRSKQCSEEWSVKATEEQSKLQKLCGEMKEQQKKKRQSLLAITKACRDLKGAADRWQGAHENLAQQFVLKNKSVHKHLVARRCHLVSAMASIFGLRPYHITLESSEFPEVEDIVDMQWWSTRHSISPKYLVEKLKLPKRGSFDRDRDRTYLGIVGLDLSPTLSRMAENGFLEWSLSHVQCESIEAAISYVASMVVLCSLYLDVPLRYPIHLMGSKTSIALPPASRLSATRNTEVISSSHEFPLFFQGTGRFSKKRLSLAFCLLAKDIHQLLSSHGVQSTEKSSLLQNLDALVAASRSGLAGRRMDVW